MKNWTAKEIKGFRKRFKLTQAKLAVRAGVSKNYIYLLEKEVKTPSRTLQLLLGYIEKDLAAQFDTTDTKGGINGKDKDSGSLQET